MKTTAKKELEFIRKEIKPKVECLNCGKSFEEKIGIKIHQRRCQGWHCEFHYKLQLQNIKTIIKLTKIKCAKEKICNFVKLKKLHLMSDSANLCNVQNIKFD